MGEIEAEEDRWTDRHTWIPVLARLFSLLRTSPLTPRPFSPPGSGIYLHHILKILKLYAHPLGAYCMLHTGRGESPTLSGFKSQDRTDGKPEE